MLELRFLMVAYLILESILTTRVYMFHIELKVMIVDLFHLFHHLDLQ